MPEHVDGNPYAVDKPTGKLNYWGYTSVIISAPKLPIVREGKSIPVREVQKSCETVS